MRKNVYKIKANEEIYINFRPEKFRMNCNSKPGVNFVYL
jgi:hypothetical protein